MAMRIGMAVVALPGVLLATDYRGGFLGPYGQGRLDVTNDVSISDIALTGTVYKTGQAQLTLVNPASDIGTLAVESGSVQLSSDAAAAALEGLAVSSNATVTVSVGADATQSVVRLDLATPLVKSGLGDLSISGGLVGPGIELGAGTISFADCEHDDVSLVFPTAGQALDVTDGTIARSVSPEGTVVKTGSGTLALAALPSDATNIEVRAGTLRVYPELANTRTAEDVAIENASFEVPSSPVGSGSYSTAAYPVGWTQENNIGLLSTSGKQGMDTKGSPWCNLADQYIPDGLYEVFLQDNCRLSKSVTLPRRGRYRLSFWVHARNGFAGGLMRVSLGDVAVADVKAVQTAPFLCTFETPVLEAGAQTLSFEGHYFSGASNRSVVLDDVKLSRIEAVPEADADRVAVANASFEWSAPMQWDSCKPRNAQDSLTDAGWTFDVKSGIAERYQSGMQDETGAADAYTDFIFKGDAPPDGRRFAFVRAEGSVSQTIDFPAAGTYELSFWIARPTSRSSGSLQVTLDGTAIPGAETLLPLQNHFRRQVFHFATTAGSHTLAFVGLSDSTDPVLIDRVEVRRSSVLNFAEFEGAYDDIVAWDEAHESDKGWVRVTSDEDKTMGGWLFHASASHSSVCGPSNSKFGSAERSENRVAVMMQNVAEISRSGIVLSEPGVYELSFETRSRGSSWNVQVGHRYDVLWNGVRLGSVRTTLTTWKRMTFQIVVPTASETGTLCFRGIYQQDIQSPSSYIDAVTLRRLPDYAVTGIPASAGKACLRLGSDAKLELMYDGSIPVTWVSRGGKRIQTASREISAETHPDWVSGPGKLTVKSRGVVILLR